MKIERQEPKDRVFKTFAIIIRIESSEDAQLFNHFITCRTSRDYKDCQEKNAVDRIAKQLVEQLDLGLTT